jgi:hypothetical protein
MTLPHPPLPVSSLLLPPPLAPTPPQVIKAELDYKYACAGNDVRAFVSEALEGVSGGGLAAAKADLLAAVEAAEKAGGGELSPANEKGWQVRQGWGVHGAVWRWQLPQLPQRG